MEDEPDGDIAVESGDEEPRAQVVPRDEARYAFPDLRRGSLRGGLVDEVYLQGCIRVGLGASDSSGEHE